ncbi:hypothetical protein J6590_033294 [Homalodisca vitripennis]|nr:hypothetical protein J6590_033294 [Homalodisca vitripennis]
MSVSFHETKTSAWISLITRSEKESGESGFHQSESDAGAARGRGTCSGLRATIKIEHQTLPQLSDQRLSLSLQGSGFESRSWNGIFTHLQIFTSTYHEEM